jgi:hypothetical protein
MEVGWHLMERPHQLESVNKHEEKVVYLLLVNTSFGRHETSKAHHKGSTYPTL